MARPNVNKKDHSKTSPDRKLSVINHYYFEISGLSRSLTTETFFIGFGLSLDRVDW